VLRATARALAPRGAAIVLLGDAELRGVRIDAREQLSRLAPAAGLAVAASASAPRPDWRGQAPRAEHLVALRRA
jgi:hypothetical protein